MLNILKELWTPQLQSAVADALTLIVTLVILPRIYKWFGVDADHKLTGTLNQALENGIRYSIDQLTNASHHVTLKEVLTGVVSNVDTKQQVIDAATEYVTGHVPDVLKKLGVSDQVVSEKLQARIQGVLQDMTKSASEVESVIGRT